MSVRRWRARMAAGLGLSAMMLGAVAGLGPALAEDVRHPLGRPSLDALRKVQRWVWHSGPVEPRAVGRSPATMLVIDPEGVPAASVQRLRRPTRQFTRLVLAQIDLASVTATREPLRGMLLGSPPAWLGPAGCGSGRRHVRYWSAAWQDILFRDQDSYIMRLLERGYDGVVLGGLEAYLRWQPERWQAAAEMAELVSELAIAVRLRRPGALVLVRNGEEIASQATVLASIDGIIRVDLMYGGEGRGRAKHESTVARSMRNLGAARRAGLPVFAFERRALHGGLHSSATLVAGLGLVLGEVIGGGEAAPSVALPPAFEEAGWPHC